jgi:hypothetical protein
MANKHIPQAVLDKAKELEASIEYLGIKYIDGKKTDFYSLSHHRRGDGLLVYIDGQIGYAFKNELIYPQD